jgi:GNAT superfamily N-acetyltransferase
VLPTDVHLRRGDPADADAVTAVHLASRRAAPMPPGVHPDDEVRRWLTARLVQDEVWVAELDGEVVGYVRLTPTWLDDLYVLPAHAGQGIGSMLIELAKALRPDGFSLWVFESNAPARAFYVRHGLVEREHTDGSDNEEKSPDLRMSWG